MGRFLHHPMSASLAAAKSVARGRCGDARVRELAGVGGSRQTVPLCWGEPNELNPAVEAGDHPEEAVAAALSVQRHTIIIEAAEPGAVERELGFLSRYIHSLTPAGLKPVVTRRKQCDCCIPARVELRNVATNLNGGTFREQFPSDPTREDRPFGPRVEGDEVVRSIACIRSSQAEWRDCH